MNDDAPQLVVDTEDHYQNDLNIFYINPVRLELLRCVSNNQFSSCLITNTSVEHLSSMNFSHILKKLKPEAQCEVQIHQLISVMQEYDSKQVEANAKLAGFDDFQHGTVELVHANGRKYKTASVTFSRPAKNNDTTTVVVEVAGKKNTTSKTTVTKTTTTTKSVSKPIKK